MGNLVNSKMRLHFKVPCCFCRQFGRFHFLRQIHRRTYLFENKKKKKPINNQTFHRVCLKHILKFRKFFYETVQYTQQSNTPNNGIMSHVYASHENNTYFLSQRYHHSNLILDYFVMFTLKDPVDLEVLDHSIPSNLLDV